MQNMTKKTDRFIHYTEYSMTIFHSQITQDMVLKSKQGPKCNRNMWNIK